MKLKFKQQLVVGFMLFSLFFGAGNLIFPPFLGYESGTSMAFALIGFLITAVVLPVLGVIIVAKFDGLDKLASKVNGKFAIAFTVLILLSIGPGLGIPRAASVPFEMAIMPYLKEGQRPELFMLLYSLIFFAIALWLALTPTKLVKRIGYVLTPSLLTLLVVLFITFFIKGDFNASAPQGDYVSAPFLKGFCEGYLTMDTIAALNFGLVISGTLFSMGVKENKEIVKYTTKTGLVAGGILSAIYLFLSYIGTAVSNTIEGAPKNGAVILRQVVHMLFGDFGAIVLAAIFTLACLTTCVGLVTSISEYFSELFHKKIGYKPLAIIIVTFSFIICNMGLDLILSISIPVLDAIYPMSIVLIMLGLFDKFYKDNKFVYPITIAVTAIVSVVYALDKILVSLETPVMGIRNVLKFIPGYTLGFGWVIFTVLAFVISLLIDFFVKRSKKAEA